MVVPPAEEVALPVGADAQHLRVLPRQPGRARAARRRQHRHTAVSSDQIHHPVEPVEIELPLGGFQARPGEDAHRHRITVGELHQAHILFPYLGGPLVRIVVAAMKEHRQLRRNRRIFFDHRILLK